MRILALTPTYPPRTGGGEKYAHRLNSELVALGHDVHVLTAVAGSDGRRTLDGVNVEYVLAPRCLGFPWFSPVLLRRRMRELDPDLILAYGPSPYDAIAAPTVRSAGRAYVQIYHADFNDRRAATRFATFAHNRTALSLANAIVCTNERMAKALADRGFGSKVTVIAPGVDEIFFDALFDGEPEGLLFVGALDADHYYKRLDLLLRAFTALSQGDPTLVLRVVGEGDRRAHFEALCSELQPLGSVQFLGRVDDEPLSGLYARASALILPSPTSQEGFGLVCLEAMAAAAPVVCSKNAGAAYLVGQAPGCGIWDGESLDDFAAKIRVACGATREERGKLRAYARRFSWANMSQRFLAQVFPLARTHGQKDVS